MRRRGRGGGEADRRAQAAETERELQEGAARADERRAAVDEAGELQDAAALERPGSPTRVRARTRSSDEG